MNSLRAEISRTKDEVVELQKVISSKEKAQVDYEKNAEEAKKAVSSARELRRELQFVKVIEYLNQAHPDCKLSIFL